MGCRYRGVYTNGAWQFELDEARYPDRFQFKFVLDGQVYMDGYDLDLQPSQQGVSWRHLRPGSDSLGAAVLLPTGMRARSGFAAALRADARPGQRDPQHVVLAVEEDGQPSARFWVLQFEPEAVNADLSWTHLAPASFDTTGSDLVLDLEGTQRAFAARLGLAGSSRQPQRRLTGYVGDGDPSLGQGVGGGMTLRSATSPIFAVSRFGLTVSERALPTSMIRLLSSGNVAPSGALSISRSDAMAGRLNGANRSFGSPSKSTSSNRWPSGA